MVAVPAGWLVLGVLMHIGSATLAAVIAFCVILDCWVWALDTRAGGHW